MHHQGVKLLRFDYFSNGAPQSLIKVRWEGFKHGYNCMKGGDGNERLSDLATYQQQLGS